MLTVQMMRGSVEVDLTNGSIQKRYHGYTTGAHRSDAAIGQANASGDDPGNLLLSHAATKNPTSTGSPAAIWGAICSSFANTGSLNRQVCTYVRSEPIGRRPSDRKSTRLNSSHMSISYAVFCLKKK